ncbi:MAG: alpha/beta fold hydrolase [Marinovum sp.]|nr:alpha/beta fold hydrolase [Marinovum sp.]
MRFVSRWVGRLLLLVIVAVAGVAFFGPTEPVVTDVDFDDSALGDDLDTYFASVERAYSDITPGTGKRVIWAGETGAKTPISILYIHGFSATSEEIRPVPDRVAEALGANLVYTRLTGHGRTGEAMADATVEAWMHDVAEALAAARRVGDEVIVMSTSTGGTLATIAAVDPDLSQGIKAQIMVSPNFRLSNPAAVLLTWPMVRQWGPIVAGKTRSFEPRNERHATYNTTSYPTVATLPMAAAVAHVRNLDLSVITHPVFLIFSNDDRVVHPDATRAVAARWGGPVTTEVVRLSDEDDAYDHVIMGDILSPANTDASVDLMVEWIDGL